MFTPPPPPQNGESADLSTEQLRALLYEEIRVAHEVMRTSRVLVSDATEAVLRIKAQRLAQKEQSARS
jgi:hypothetical protein